MLRRSSVFAAEAMDVFNRTPTDKELVSQGKALCKDYIHSRLIRAGLGWSKPEQSLSAAGGLLGEVSSILLWLGKKTTRYTTTRPLEFTVASLFLTLCFSAHFHWNDLHHAYTNFNHIFAAEIVNNCRISDSSLI